MLQINKQNIENKIQYFIEDVKYGYSVLIEKFTNEVMASVFIKLYKKATNKEGKIFPCRNLRWKECLAMYEDEYLLWYQDINCDTGIVR